MILLVVIAIKLAKDLDNICIGVGSTEGIARAIKAKNELGVLIRDNGCLDVSTTSAGCSRLRAGWADS